MGNTFCCNSKQRNQQNQREPEGLEKYSLGDYLGDGGFAKVYKATRNLTQKHYAIKRSKPGIDLDDFYHEVEINKKLKKHPYIVDYIEHWRQEDDFYIVMEYCKGGTLLDYICRDEQYIPQPKILQFLWEITQGLKHLHSHQVLHKDIKASNILLFDHGSHCKIADYGVAKKI